jgi:thiosulfate/3-mercaptopyruvate sulfurtransferase
MAFFEHMIETSELAEHFLNPDWVVFDCRFDLMNPNWGEDEYASGHIPGAIYAHLEHDLSGPVTPATSRHPLPDPEIFVECLSAWGVTAGKQVVVYDSAGGAFASRLWWMLHYYGHKASAVLNGGYAKWAAEGRPTRQGVEWGRPAEFTPIINESMLVDAAFVEQVRSNRDFRIIDARSAPRYNGEEEPIDPVAGHIPGAVNRFHGENLSIDGVLIPIEELSEQFTGLIGSVPASNVIVYCGSGVTSCHHILAMSAAGLGMPKLYAGSWSEWIRDPSRPVSQKE